jgi:glutamate-1-semialdehyde 2,1-aminomutase
MKTVAIIQARMGSTRLPGKVLQDLAGRPVLGRVVERAKRAQHLDAVTVATSTAAADDAVAAWCADSGVPCFRGSEADVLDRYAGAAREFGAGVVVRLTADCPLIDPDVIDMVVAAYFAQPCDYAANIIEPTFPDGLDTEVFSCATLQRAAEEAQLPSEREHVTPYILSHPELFRLVSVRGERDLSAMRWTVDEPRDLALAREIYALLGDGEFGMREVLALVEAHPHLLARNAGIERNEGYRRSLEVDASQGTGQRLYRAAKQRIPGGTQLLSKRPEMFLPEQWPAYYSRAAGADVWDLDGRRYVDMSYSGIGSCVLGFADPDVNAAVQRAVADGSMATLNCPEEVELADLLCELHPWADMVRYTRSGGEAMAVAVRIARAATGRDHVAFCGYHGWHDWYLAANLASDRALDGHLLPGLDPAGVPRGLTGTALPFRYNQLDELETIIADHGDDIAAIVMEPTRGEPPAAGFLAGVRALADRIGAVLVADEITAAFRLNTGGAHLLLGLEPDIAVFAKAMSNGFPMAAIIGRTAVMEASQGSFISSTYWTDRIGPTAALATIRKHRDEGVHEYLVRTGQRVKQVWTEEGARAGLTVHVSGMDPLAHFGFDLPEPAPAHTLFTQLMLDRGFLASKAFYATFAHSDEHVDGFRAAVAESFQVLAAALRDDSVAAMLRGPLAHNGFRRLA